MELKQALITLSDEERRIIDEYKAATGLSIERGTSVAIRQIIREWNRLKALEQAGTIRGNKKVSD